jgi:hypothetical protein
MSDNQKKSAQYIMDNMSNANENAASLRETINNLTNLKNRM